MWLVQRYEKTDTNPPNRGECGIIEKKWELITLYVVDLWFRVDWEK